LEFNVKSFLHAEIKHWIHALPRHPTALRGVEWPRRWHLKECNEHHDEAHDEADNHCYRQEVGCKFAVERVAY